MDKGNQLCNCRKAAAARRTSTGIWIQRRTKILPTAGMLVRVAFTE
jgi:hypothetical protein